MIPALRRSSTRFGRAGQLVLVAGLLLTACTAGAPTGEPVGTIASSSHSAAPPSGADSAPAASATSAAATSAAPGCEGGAPCYTGPVATGTISAGAAPEASGVAPSSSTPGLFFVVDDGSGVSRIVAIRTDGSVVATIEVDGMKAGNAEAIAPGVCEQGSTKRCLYIGDIGADPARTHIVVYRIDEPDAANLPPAAGPVPSQAWEYTYPDGKYNAESLLIGDDGSVVVVTKVARGSTEGHRVYRGAPGGGELTLASTFELPEPLSPRQSLLVGNLVTDASRLADRVVLLTYDQAVEYLAPTPGADPAAFSSWPFRQLAIPSQWQSEGISYLGAAGLPDCGFIVVSEKGGGRGPAVGTVGCA